MKNPKIHSGECDHAVWSYIKLLLDGGKTNNCENGSHSCQLVWKNKKLVEIQFYCPFPKDIRYIAI